MRGIGAALEARLPDILADIEELVTTESPTADPAAVAKCAEVVAALGARLTGSAPERLTAGGRPHLRWRFGSGDRVLLLGHFDTVWPVGSLATHPYAVTGGRLTGPGCFDMKSGLVQLFHALSVLDDLDGVTVLATSDEETGSATSRELIEAAARRTGAVLVLEASAEGALKTARKGVSTYDLRITGRAAHAGLEPHLGVNASVELAHQVLAIAALADPGAGTSVTPTVLTSGTTRNTVPASAEVLVDVRAWTTAEQARVDAAFRGLPPVLAGATLSLSGGPARAPLQHESSAALFVRARKLYDALGYGDLQGVSVGGGSDGNLTAGAGAPTLDGLGAVGGGAHADDEHVVVAELPRRAALVTALVHELAGERK
ncbi:M20/M25/M40 family metallo-hydrolase [Streptomyces sp. ISL-98]|uniref:M20/M25/M40 family metallo-hydrolase n=1 Tax=Streptomyces sp. ISL-98 TaxID=2819192 RepID=UPI001BE997CF|nr:M20/M25/M40 family metallo-hydrolase [Streptomyces sp. ISL-98]MBT2506041.1 M20/M25/M40 family metallo-hydrolase [Streptomyces sp. ISL-98]